MPSCYASRVLPSSVTDDFPPEYAEVYRQDAEVRAKALDWLMADLTHSILFPKTND